MLHLILPTVRSRCQSHVMAVPSEEQANAWLLEQGIDAAQIPVLWRASGSRPDWVLQRWSEGLRADMWAQWPRLLARGQAGLLELMPVTEGLACLQKLCHDLMAVGLGLTPRFFQAEDLPKKPSPMRAADWAVELNAMAAWVDRPFQPVLQLQAWTARARMAMRAR